MLKAPPVNFGNTILGTKSNPRESMAASTDGQMNGLTNGHMDGKVVEFPNANYQTDLHSIRLKSFFLKFFFDILENFIFCSNRFVQFVDFFGADHQLRSQFVNLSNNNRMGRFC